MGKNKRRDQNRHQSNGNSASATTRALPVAQGPAALSTPPNEVIQQAEEIADRNMTEDDIESLSSESNADQPSQTLDEWAKRAATAIALLDRQRVRIEEKFNAFAKKEEALGKREEAVERRTTDLKAEAERIKEQSDQVAAQKHQLSKDQEALNEREAQVKGLELEAESGFTGRFQQWLSRFDAQRAELEKELDELRKDEVKIRLECESSRRLARQALLAELDEIRKAEREQLRDERHRADAELLQLKQSLEEDHKRLAAEKASLRSEQRQLTVEKEVLAENKKLLQLKIEQMAAARVEAMECQVLERDELLKAARADRKRLAETLALRQEADLRFGARSPEEVLDELRALTQERDALQSRLAAVPSAQTRERLRQLEEERERFQAERADFLDENRSLKARLARADVAVIEVESLRDQKTALETSRGLLHAALSELRTDVNERIKRSDGRCPFPTSAAMDADDDLQSALPSRDGLSSLPLFVDEIRHRIADDRTTGKRLYYSERDLRSFLGGLAMSRLHLLQGISGTGKTSLPVAFARAIGAECKVIEIQAGWRDRQDLIGHYNAFERKFYESEFLLALYRAGCPRHDRLPFIIVLDEMNLSHPEQYFAEFLSKLEQDPQRRVLELTTEAVDPAPRLFVDGRTLPLPRNVWFIGTANHDETTKDFADKTYDRAHVMELPRHPGEFEVRSIRDQEPISLQALQNAFADARRKHLTKANEAYTTLKDALGETLPRRFAVNWGNRLERQISEYVPVVVESGGSVGEALDHIIATKLIRKIRNRHDNRPEHIKELLDQLQLGLQKIDSKWMRSANPRDIQSTSMVEDEYAKLGGDVDE
jgi:hypothetical protein